MSNKVYGVCRVSSVSQSDNTSIKNQKDTIKKYCDLYNLDLVEIVEEVFTGTTENRDGLNYLMDKVKSGECDTIVVYKIDRLMRDFRSGINFIGDLIKNGCKIISTQEQIDTSSISGEFFMNVLLSMSQMEKQTITQRLQRGKEYRFKTEGKRVCSKPPFGYRKENNTIVIDKEKSEIVKLIFKLSNRYIELSKSDRTKKIMKSLNKRGYSITRHQMRYYLRNEFYKGFHSFGGEVVKHQYPTLISPRLFNKVNQSL